MLGGAFLGGDMFSEDGVPSFFGENARIEMTEYTRDPETGRLQKMIKKGKTKVSLSQKIGQKKGNADLC